MAEKTMKISLIIATWNAKSTIQRCLDSIVNQLTDECELIIIDGGSTDGTVSILNKYRNYITYLISEKDKGLYDAWNKGIRQANGEWIAFLGADDCLMPDYFSFYINYLQNDTSLSVDIISGEAKLIDKQGRLLSTIGKEYKWDQFKYSMTIAHGSTLHNKKLFKEIGLFDTEIGICADYDFLLRKHLVAKFVNKEMILMSAGGRSQTLKGVFNAFIVRKKNKSIPLWINMLLLAKASIGLLYRKYFLYMFLLTKS